MKCFAVIAVLLMLVVSCDRPEQSGVNRFSDTVLIKIADFRDRRLSDSLYQYFKHDNPFYRRDAVLAFASIQDSIAVGKIAQVFAGDEDYEVRMAAAFALGQLGSKAVAFLLANTKNNDTVLTAAYEAFGKVTDTVFFSKVVPDEGIAWACYRLGLRGLSDSAVNAMAVRLLDPSHAERTRLGIAHYFARGAKAFERQERVLRVSAAGDSAVEVRMACVLAMRKIKTDSSLMLLQQVFQHDNDYRVRVNAIRALQSFPIEQTKNTLVTALADENINVGIMAAEVLKANASKAIWQELAALARKAKNWRIQGNLYDAALAASDHKALAEEIAGAVKSSKNPYQKAALITALQTSVMSFGFIGDQLFKADTPVVRSSSAAALVAINHLKNFDAALKERFAGLYTKAIQTGDAAVIATVAGALGDSTLGYKNVIGDVSFLYEARKKLSLPKDNEVLQSLEAAKAYLEGKKNPPVIKNEFNHPINWKLVRSLPKDQKMTISTSKGDIVIRLFVEEAPGSVANFVELANRHYFDDKFFHRVVPNFVAQAGCNRGDGWGGEDYSIRSEFSPRRYKTGSVGMASAGKDTEGTQWFIAHSPTPHLDGRYTIFAEVESGMEIVHMLEVGDKILKVRRNND